jgi:hypothetical protein
MAFHGANSCDPCGHLLKLRVEIASGISFFTMVSLLVLFMLFYIQALLSKLIFSEKASKAATISATEKNTMVIVCNAKAPPESPFLTVLA